MRDASRGTWGGTLVLLLAVTALGAILVSRNMLQRRLEVTPLSLAPEPGFTPLVVTPTATEPIVPPPPTATATAAGETAQRAYSTSQPTRYLSVAVTRSLEDLPVTSTRASELAGTAETPSTPSTAVAIARVSTTLPTALKREEATTILTPTGVPSAPPLSTATPKLAPEPLYTLRQRMGVAASGHRLDADVADLLGLGWYLNWHVDRSPFRSAHVEYVPMIRLRDGTPVPSGQELLPAIEANPGALWLIGNEPDVKWQDNVPPDVYARLYHELYHLIKRHDPSSRVAIGGITQPSPLRLHYLDLILDNYESQYGEPTPVDVWHVHNFVLREERDNWGVDIPPGIDEHSGLLREIDDHDSLPLFEEQIVSFRRWMKERGQQSKPLIVTEYGILMPVDYGFPPEQVESFMLKTFEFFRTATDPDLGYPPDAYRLVQRWCWYSLADTGYPTGNLYQPETGNLTSLGAAYRRYAQSEP